MISVKHRGSTAQVLKLHMHGVSDVGLVCQKNEDACWFDEQAGVLVVADGVGGNAAGEVASQAAVQYLRDHWISWLKSHVHKNLAAETTELIQALNKSVHELSQHPNLTGMSTTLVMLGCAGDHLVLAHVGDSRCYRYRRGRVEQLTEDHSVGVMMQKMAREGLVELNEGADNPEQGKSALMQSIGKQDHVDPTVTILEPENGDIFLLCSDWVSDLVDAPEMATLIKSEQHDPKRICSKVMERVRERGAHDNTTLIVARVAGPLNSPTHRRVGYGVLVLLLAVLLAGIGWLYAKYHASTKSVPLVETVVEESTNTVAEELKAGSTFHDCEDGCPEMVVVPTVSFMMGSPNGVGSSDEHPQHEVTINYRLAQVAHSGLAIKKPALSDTELMSQGMWRDPNTHMIWMRCSLGQTWNGSTCTDDAIRYSWDAAQEAVATLNRNGGYGGYTDWIVPHIQDLSSLIVCSAGTQSRDAIPAKGGFDIVIDADCAKTSVSPTLDPLVFPNTADFFYLSASSVLHWHDNAWVVSFNNGTISDYLYNKTDQAYVRGVRAVSTD